MKPETSATLKVLALGCFIIFLVFLGLAAPFYLRQRTVLKTWPIVRATVESANITPVNVRHGTNYMARFLVQYRVGDQVRTATVPSGYADRNRSHAQQWLDNFPVGSTVTVAYNPEDPALVRINPGFNRYFFAVPLFITKIGLIFAAAAIVLMIVARWGDSTYRRTTPQESASTR
jgi:ribosomal protein L21E